MAYYRPIVRPFSSVIFYAEAGPREPQLSAEPAVPLRQGYGGPPKHPAKAAARAGCGRLFQHPVNGMSRSVEAESAMAFLMASTVMSARWSTIFWPVAMAFSTGNGRSLPAGAMVYDAFCCFQPNGTHEGARSCPIFRAAASLVSLPPPPHRLSCFRDRGSELRVDGGRFPHRLPALRRRQSALVHNSGQL